MTTLFDIHSHILFGVDDGPKTIEESISLIKKMQNEGITKILATPHFYPQDTDLADYLKIINNNFKTLKNVTQKNNLPEIYLGCELLYFSGLGQSTSLHNLCLNNTNYLLLELTDNCINNRLFSDIKALIKQSGIVPVIAHIERYCKAKNFKKLLQFVSQNNIPIQVNAASFSIFCFRRAIKKIIKNNIPILLGTDSHSVDMRPPKLQEALQIIEKKYGIEFKEQILNNNKKFMRKIVG